jgi:CelD/BcsL family acetyltransferase involved in cellulose biosynthesis
MSAEYTLKIITNIQQTDTLEDSWRALTEKNIGCKSNIPFFMSWDWIQQWLRTYQEYILTLKIICIMRNNECIAIAPFYICQSRVLGMSIDSLSLIATNEPENCEVASEHMDIAFSPQYKHDIIQLLASHLKQCTDFNQYHLKDIHKNSLVYQLTQILRPDSHQYQEQLSGYQFTIDTNKKICFPDAFLKKKKRVLNKFVKLNNEERCEFNVAKSKNEALALYKQLVHLHQKRWQPKNKPGVFSNTHFYNFHKQLIKNSFHTNMITLSAITADNQIISVNYSINWHNTLYFYQSGIDDTYKPNLSPGLLNHLLLVNYCQENNIEQYNLLKSSEKDDYKSQFSQLGDELIDITMLSSVKMNIVLRTLKIIKRIRITLSKRFE